MTNLGTTRRLQDSPHPSNGLQVLGKIAAVLAIPVQDFFRDEVQASSAATPSAAECELLMTAFLRVRDPEIRNRIVGMLRAYSGN